MSSAFLQAVHTGRRAMARMARLPGLAWRALDANHSDGRRHYYGRPSSARVSLLRRGLLVLTLIAIVVMIFVLGRDGLRDSFDETVSIPDAIYFAFVTITTVGYGDIVPVTTAARLLDALLVTPIRVLVWAIFLGTAYQFVIQRLIEDIRMRIRQSELLAHTIICGFGHSGQSAARELSVRGVAPEQIVVIDSAEPAMISAAEQRFVGLRGDATQERTLLDARVAQARTVIVCLGRDDAAALCVLTIRALAPGLRIVATVRDAENEPLLRRAGASATICPSVLTGILMANSAESSHVASYITDLVTSKGRVTLLERAATSEDVGKTANELADGLLVRIHRGDKIIGFWESGAKVCAGDQLLVVTPRTVAAPAPQSVT